MPVSLKLQFPSSCSNRSCCLRSKRSDPYLSIMYLTLSQTTNFRRFNIQRVWKQFKYEFSKKGKKHWEKEKLLITSNFSFSHSVYKRLVLQTCKSKGLYGNGLKTQRGILKWAKQKMLVIITFQFFSCN